MPIRPVAILAAALALAVPLVPLALAQPKVIDGMPRPMELIRGECSRVMRTMQTPSAKRFLTAASWLPVIDERVVYWNKTARKGATPEEYAALSADDQKLYEERKLDEGFHYYTKYGSPVAYARAIDLVAAYMFPLEADGAKLPPVENAFLNRKILDFGFGGIGHLRLLASIGAEAVGVEIDDLLRAYYTKEDQGAVEGAPIGGKPGDDGSLRLIFGSFPSDPKIVEQVGEKYDLIISKNTLKRGYIAPEHPVDERKLVKLGVSDDEFVGHLARVLKPGGLVMIYNICPAQKPDPKDYIPWADGRCPFPREMLEKHGFRVVEFDKSDDEAARTLGKALNWDDQGMDLQNDLFAWYTLLEKKAEPAKAP